MATIYGYIRVSTEEQHEDRQLYAMQKLQIKQKNIYIDKASGKHFKRPMYRKLISRMRKGDVLYIKSIDRLGRNYREILEQWRILTREKQIHIVVMDMPLLDTRKDENLLGSFISDIVLQILSFVAENERDNIRKRQAEGIAVAKAKGVHLGRPARPLPVEFPEIYRKWKQKELTGVAAAASCHMPVSTFRYRAELYEKSLEK